MDYLQYANNGVVDNDLNCKQLIKIIEQYCPYGKNIWDRVDVCLQFDADDNGIFSQDEF